MQKTDKEKQKQTKYTDSTKGTIEIIKDRLYWICDTQAPKNLPNAFYFCIDTQLVYQPFSSDFGPLNLGMTFKYIRQLERLLSNKQFLKNKLYHYCSTQSAKSANAAYLMCAFQMIILKRSSEEAWKPFNKIKFVPFRDASYGDCSYKCTILDCLRGLEYATKLGWFDYKTFNINEYEHYEKIENGDLNWIVPNKFIAFSSPSQHSQDNDGNLTFTPADYVPIFRKFNIGLVIRLNTKTYEASGFTKEGIKHNDMYFPDGSVPSSQIVDRFLEVTENEKQCVAVHCKAGLGRTGSLIACYVMKHYQFNAADFIGWIRIARPGSILGPQQHFLLEIEKEMKERGKNSSIWKQVSNSFAADELDKQMKALSFKDKDMNDQEKEVKSKGDYGQGEKLVNSKMKSNSPPSFNKK